MTFSRYRDILLITRFYGLTVKMYLLGKEHNPPHIHVVYGEYLGVIDIRTSKMLEGDLPNKALKIVQEWVGIHRDALLTMWETQNITPLPPIE